ncbi:putative sulfate/molybdate transporter [Halorubrum sp. DTA98]|uniref:putative sulfate/molybdate transporter n=1 Tax=Halorubrum sp. DTA98 TaxID=3402163 RepID=UPI003AADA19F
MGTAGETTGAGVRIDLNELTGALGDSITVLPIVVSLALLTPLSLAHTLVAFGVFQIVWGIVYGIPLSVEPMKALAGLAIAGAISLGELVAAGLIAGVVLLVAGRYGVVGAIERVVGLPVVRGIQLAVALLLGVTGLQLAAGNPPVAAAATAVVLLVALAGYRDASALVVLGIGGAVAVFLGGVPTPTLPDITVFASGGPSFTVGALEGAAAQLAMTVGNAAVATALLCSDLFDEEVSADRLAESMGVMTLAALPMGGLPMCHGSGGLAGKHAFGARTGGANVILGVGYLALALIAVVVVAFPMAVLGVLLVLVAVELARVSMESDDRLLTVGVGVLGVAANVGIAFVVGAVVGGLLRKADVRSRGDPRMTFAELFDRAVEYTVDEETVREALDERRSERGDDR